MTREEETAHAALMLQYLLVDPFTGACIWEVSPRGQARVGKVAGTVDREGYEKIRLQGKAIRTHRLIWFFVHGRMPINEIDHINGDRGHNSIFNLRECAVFENSQNKPIIASNTSGFAGVNFDRRLGLWRARIMLKGTRIELGYFGRREQAGAAYIEHKRQLHRFAPTVREKGAAL